MNTTWNKKLKSLLISTHGEKIGTLLAQKYTSAFSNSYVEDWTAEQALLDIQSIEYLSSQNGLDLEFYDDEIQDSIFHIKVFQYENPIPLSDVLPMLENMDLRTISERPYKVMLNQTLIWLSDFTVSYTKSEELKVDEVKDIFKEAFLAIRAGHVENDGFNKLLLSAQIAAREITILRAYAKYLHQTQVPFSQSYIEQTFANNAAIVREMISLFKTLHNPHAPQDDENIKSIEENIYHQLDAVISLDEDRILRSLLNLIKNTLRTNYYQKENEAPKDYIALKFDSKNIPELPQPVPLYEIFVYSPRFEGIHLRAAKVARGGIRLSDRPEDFRVEVLGLMKAQKVKNAVIVPSGAKGGFIIKNVAADSTREMMQQEVIRCYKSFISGLLDLTDNLKNGSIVPPKDVVCFDDADPYLVVAADKGTATFSDIANSLSKHYEFWLGDAFASGGSAGYDHKKMGITARGAWESVKRHFHELNINVAENVFTVVGIGDMSGDVFGNGMLYTQRIKLVAALDHRHIFLDPNPNPQLSYQERLRLFKLPHSSWDDYNREFISAGGGVFSRKAKSIPLSLEIKKVLDITADSLTPNELIRTILKAPVDLLWNGGIGTYVKASDEHAIDVGDKTNDNCRINGIECRARIVGEGGNLGFTQLGRIEYALKGGLINTDFIDNSAGVDCSDHEVNIKILLNEEMRQGKLTQEKRDELLESMTLEVAELVLADNYHQALALSYSNFYAKNLITLHQSYLSFMETHQIVDRQIEFLPSEKNIVERRTAGLSFTRPELAVIMAYTKIHLKNAILQSNIPEDNYLRNVIDVTFPKKLLKIYHQAIGNHHLRREIIATQLSNQIVNEMGFTFVYSSQIETGAEIPEVVRSYIVASMIFKAPEMQQLIGDLDFKISLSTQYELLSHIRHLVNLATRWFLRHKPFENDEMPTVIRHFSLGIEKLEPIIPTLMEGSTKKYLESLSEQFMQAGISKEMALKIASTRALYTALNIIEITAMNEFDMIHAAKVYFAVGVRFNLLWFRDQLAMDSRDGYWERLARFSIRDELDFLQKTLTVLIINHNREETNVDQVIEQWIHINQRAISRWEKTLGLLYSNTSIDYSMFFITLRVLSDLIHSNEIH